VDVRGCPVEAEEGDGPEVWAEESDVVGAKRFDIHDARLIADCPEGS
jgi:hypothetical protein